MGIIAAGGPGVGQDGSNIHEKKGGFSPGMLNQLSAKSLHGIDKDSFGDYQGRHHVI